jgi:hypothetical protein
MKEHILQAIQKRINDIQNPVEKQLLEVVKATLAENVPATYFQNMGLPTPSPSIFDTSNMD